MSLFQNSVLNKYLKGLESEKVNEAYERFTSHFHNPTIQENIRNSKEEQYQGEFLIDLFVNVFGYTKNPTPDFNLTTELKNIRGSKKTDGAILKGEKALAVIELKGTNTTDLSKVETQAFGYKNNQPGCNYVITSNFEKLRFYIDNAVDFEEFNLFQLTKERFDVLWLCLSSEYLLKDIPKKIKDESLTQEENITKKLYKDYASFRNEIFDSIQKENLEYDKLTLFKKTQKLLDRFLFIFFAEDRLLLPPNSIRSIVNQWTDLRDKYDEYFPLYDRFQKYFGYMNTGHKGQQHDIFAYNGGLFAPDEILDNIKINDELLYKHTLNLSNYDFESEVSVNILGHIFEHSLNDIEEIQLEIQGVLNDEAKTKRQKDGVFYTPKYITKYIVDNTIGKLCEEKKTELDIQEAEYEKERKGRKKTTLKNLTKKLDTYRKWLLQITICDPACGSGAFLNQALEFLIAEHQYIDELQAKLFGDAMILSEVENAILENNLFGVDINEESIEIAKLSLWLRTAQKGRKLTSLNNNIKCGNSLIDASDVASDKAFNWEEEFPKVFKNGGFDIVIGNPPYLNFKMYSSFERSFYELKYPDSYSGKADILYYFFDKGSSILNENGKIGFITSRYWLESEYASKLRKVLLERLHIREVLDFKNITIFPGVGTKTSILIGDKIPAIDLELKIKYIQFNGKIIDTVYDRLDTTDIYLNYDSLYALKFWEFYSKTGSIILDKMKSEGIELNEIADCRAGIQTGCDKAFITTNRNDFSNVSQELIKTWVKVGDLSRYSLEPVEKRWLVYSNDIEDIDSIPDLKERFLIFEDKLRNRREAKNGKIRWFDLQWAREKRLFDDTKILCRYKAPHNTFVIDYNGNYSSVDTTIVQLNEEWKEKVDYDYLLGILNSKLLDYFFKSYAKVMDYRYEYYPNPVGKLMIKIANSSEQLKVKELVIKIRNSINEQTQIIKQTSDLISVKFNIKKLSKKLQNWSKLDFKSFLLELKKKKVELDLNEEAQWMKYFNEQKEKVQNINMIIENNEKELDNLIYGLYGLTKNEMTIVEDAYA
ncbi:N-6 DNA methylase [Aequorivita sp. F47161]|uniref:site-specific DNA-methyltransferase (adenine-specific) n=1 Tax=Aequorivita vitellina TaxID=2874475 RepID=A0A9X1U2B2_9FLAO|nr:DNA methyltransferase [Aequorivita vitellina]MCG2420469.1 N-6 DNA methylase [Aequorivita vitellina]